jgi:hypothetical protein
MVAMDNHMGQAFVLIIERGWGKLLTHCNALHPFDSNQNQICEEKKILPTWFCFFSKYITELPSPETETLASVNAYASKLTVFSSSKPIQVEPAFDSKWPLYTAQLSDAVGFASKSITAIIM